MTTQHLDVLIVDDSKDAADSMVTLMSLLGHRAKAAYSGREAIESVNETPPLCVMLDVHMPDMNGLELARALRQKCGQDIVLIAVTGSEDKLATEVFDLVDCHFFKPVSAEALAKSPGFPDFGRRKWRPPQLERCGVCMAFVPGDRVSH